MWHGDHHYGSGDNQWSAFNHEAIVSCTPQKLSDRNPGTDPTRVRLLCPNTCGMAIIITEVAIISGLLLIMKRLSPVRLKNSQIGILARTRQGLGCFAQTHVAWRSSLRKWR